MSPIFRFVCGGHPCLNCRESVPGPINRTLNCLSRSHDRYLDLEDVTERTPEARDFILKRIKDANYGWMETFEEHIPTVLYNIHGGVEWLGGATDPYKGLLYVVGNNMSQNYNGVSS